jgi:hypothetical protein
LAGSLEIHSVTSVSFGLCVNLRPPGPSLRRQNCVTRFRASYGVPRLLAPRLLGSRQAPTPTTFNPASAFFPPGRFSITPSQPHDYDLIDRNRPLASSSHRLDSTRPDLSNPIQKDGSSTASLGPCKLSLVSTQRASVSSAELTLASQPRDDVYGAYDASYMQPSHGPSQRTQQPIVTGTSVVAMKFKDGVVIAADNLGI